MSVYIHAAHTLIHRTHWIFEFIVVIKFRNFPSFYIQNYFLSLFFSLGSNNIILGCYHFFHGSPILTWNFLGALSLLPLHFILVSTVFSWSPIIFYWTMFILPIVLSNTSLTSNFYLSTFSFSLSYIFLIYTYIFKHIEYNNYFHVFANHWFPSMTELNLFFYWFCFSLHFVYSYLFLFLVVFEWIPNINFTLCGSILGRKKKTHMSIHVACSSFMQTVRSFPVI